MNKQPYEFIRKMNEDNDDHVKDIQMNSVQSKPVFSNSSPKLNKGSIYKIIKSRVDKSKISKPQNQSSSNFNKSKTYLHQRIVGNNRLPDNKNDNVNVRKSDSSVDMLKHINNFSTYRNSVSS